MRKNHINKFVILITISILCLNVISKILDNEVRAFNINTEQKDAEIQKNPFTKTESHLEEIYCWDNNYGSLSDICVQSGVQEVVYIAEGGGGLLVLDTTDPLNPVVNNQYEDGVYYREIMQEGNRLYAIAEEEINTNFDNPNYIQTIQILDISDTTNIKKIDRYESTGYILCFYVEDNILYLIESIFIIDEPVVYNLRILDVEDINDIKDLSVLDIGFSLSERKMPITDSASFAAASKVEIKKQYNYLVLTESDDYYYSTHKLYLLIDVSDKLNPIIEINKVISNSNCISVDVYLDYLYLTAQKYVAKYSIIDPTNPILEYNWSIGITHKKLTIDENIIYLITSESNIVALNKSNLELITSEPIDYYFYNYFRECEEIKDYYYIRLSGIYLYTFTYFNQIEIMQNNNHTWIKKGEFKNGTPAVQIETNENYAIVLEMSGQITFYDLANPSDPKFVCEYYNRSFYGSIQVDDNFLYAVTFGLELDVYDISSPKEITKVSYHEIESEFLSISPIHTFFRLEKDGDNLYLFYYDVAYFNPRCVLFYINVNSLENITSKLLLDISCTFINCGSFFVRDDVLYLVQCGSIRIYNIEDKNNPYQLSYLSYYDYFKYSYYGYLAMEIQNDYLFFADHKIGLLIVNISDVETPEFISYCNLSLHLDESSAHAERIAVDEKYAYVECFGSKHNVISVIDISDVGNPQFVLQKEHLWPIEDMIVKNGVLFTAAGYDDFRVYELKYDRMSKLGTIIIASCTGAAGGIIVITIIILMYRRREIP